MVDLIVVVSLLYFFRILHEGHMRRMSMMGVALWSGLAFWRFHGGMFLSFPMHALLRHSERLLTSITMELDTIMAVRWMQRVTRSTHANLEVLKGSSCCAW